MAAHYFSPDAGGAGLERRIRARIRGRNLTFTTADGVFSTDGLDHATAILLETVEPPAGGRILDLGCGWGPIACTLAAEPDTEVWAVDINERARELTIANAQRLGVAVRVAAPEDVPADLRFDAIWSNPPIRIGKAALHDLLLTWLARLTPTGDAHLVVGKNLGADSLQRWLIEQGWPCERVNSAKGFRVLRVQAGLAAR